MQHLNSSSSSVIAPVPTGNLAASVVLGFCFALGVPGNIAVMVLLTGWLKEDSFTPRLMMSLAVSDLLTLLSLPMWIWEIMHGWIFGLFLCKFASYMVYTGHYCSILCLILLSVQRFMQVLHPQKWAKLGERGKKILLIAMWMLSALLALYGPVQHGLTLKKGGSLYCGLLYRDDLERVATLFWETIMLTASLLLLAFFYFCLLRGVNRSAFFKSHKLAKLVTRIVVTLFIFWTPLIVNNILLITAHLLRNDRLLRAALAGSNATAALSIINCCVDPFLYAFSARTLRRKQQEQVMPMSSVDKKS